MNIKTQRINEDRIVWKWTDIGLSGGVYTLTHSGSSSAFRVWSNDSNTNLVPGERIPQGDELSTYVPFNGGGAPAIASTSPRWVTFTVVTNVVTNCATLSMTQEYAEGFKVWDMAFEGVTTNGSSAYFWQGESNAFLRAECPTNATGATLPLTLSMLDIEFEGLTNEVHEAFSLYLHGQTNGFWGSTYSITEPRADIGMPAFSSRNAFVVHFDPKGTAVSDPVCEISVGGGTPVSVPLTRNQEGAYVSCLVVPVSELDGEADLGLESSIDAVKLKLYGGTGWLTVKIDIGTVIGGTMKKIVSEDIPVRQAALFSALVTNEENGEARANQAVTQAGNAAISRLKYGVTPLFSPDKQQINGMLPRHRVWVHSGHGHHQAGISILAKTGNTYSHTTFKASDITADGLDYDLVFMNTCESTDTKYTPVPPILPQAVGGWYGPHVYTNGHAMLDIGNKLNAKNYIGWDCEIVRQLSVTIPRMLMQELDSTGTGNGDRRTVAQAVQIVQEKLQIDRPDYYWYWERIKCIENEAIYIDLNKKPF